MTMNTKKLFRVRKTKPSTARTTSDDPIPIPGVKEILSYWEEHGQDSDRFSRPEVYIKQVMDEVSYTLSKQTANYDMDDEDEEWLIDFNGGSFGGLSDESFELIVDAFEKAIFCCPDEFKNGDCNGRVPASCLWSGLCSEDVAEAVYGYWLKKRKRRKSALVRVFEAHKVKKRRGRKKNWNQLESDRRTATVAVNLSATEYAVEDQEHDDMKKLLAAEETARKLGDLAVKKRKKAQLIMTNADSLILKAKIALRIAEVAQFRESLRASNSVPTGLSM